MSAARSDPLLDLIADTQGLLEIAELRDGLLDAIQRVIPCNFISLNDVSPDPEETVAIARPELSAEAIRAFAELAHENPLVRRYRKTKDGRAYRFSDVTTPAELHALRIYREFYRPLGVEYQIAFTLPSRSERILAIALTRAHADFTDSERRLLDRARPFLIQAYQNSIEYERARAAAGTGAEAILARLRAAGLTAREAEVLRYAGLGRSNRDTGRALGISERTVAKHLQRCYAKLGADNRSEAAAIVWTIADQAPNAFGR